MECLNFAQCVETRRRYGSGPVNLKSIPNDGLGIKGCSHVS
jgi:hypothetical protein